MDSAIFFPKIFFLKISGTSPHQTKAAESSAPGRKGTTRYKTKKLVPAEKPTGNHSPEPQVLRAEGTDKDSIAGKSHFSRGSKGKKGTVTQ
jgi:hypothetical protein